MKTKLLLFIACTLFCDYVSAQERIYFEETFTNGRLGDMWNKEESSYIDAAGDPVYVVDISPMTAIAGWVYDPDGNVIAGQTGRGVATTMLDGQYLLVTNPFQMESSRTLNMLSLDFEYMASTTVKGDVRNFGLMVRDTAVGVWDTVFTLFEADETLETSLTGTVGMTLPESYTGKVVELALYFTNEDLTEAGNLYFGFFVSNLKFAAYEAEALFSMSNLSRPYASGNPATMKIQVVNEGALAIDTMDFSYQLGEGAAKTLRVAGDIAALSSSILDLPLDLGEAEANADYTLTLRCTAVNGVGCPEPKSLSWNFTYLDTTDVVPFVPVVEHFTASTCSPSYVAANMLNPIYEKVKGEGRLNIIKYQMNFPAMDPYYIADNGVRANYYGVDAIPTIVYCGTSEVNYPDLASNMETLLAVDYGQPTPVSIECLEFKVDTLNERMSARLEVRSAIDIRSAKFFATLIEGTTTRNRRTNGETEFHYVTMSHLAGPHGEDARYAAGEAVEYEYNIDLSGTHIEEMTDLELVCFVQDPDAGDVFQSAGFADVVYGEVEVLNPENHIKITIANDTVHDGGTYWIRKIVDTADLALDYLEIPTYLTVSNQTNANLNLHISVSPIDLPVGSTMQFCALGQCQEIPADVSGITLAPNQVLGGNPNTADEICLCYTIPTANLIADSASVSLVFEDLTHDTSTSFIINFVTIPDRDSISEIFIPIDEDHFPDAFFRGYMTEYADMDADGQLSEEEVSGVTGIDVSGMGIQDLKGIEYFTELESLDCSDNELTSLDLSANAKLQILKAESNRLNIALDEQSRFDLSQLPDFDITKASDWEGCTRIGNSLTFIRQEVSYSYATGYNGENEDVSLQSVIFRLMADRDPSVANEASGLQSQGRVYAKDHVICTEGIETEINVYSASGSLLYRGFDKEIPVRHEGLYLVRSGSRTWKVLVM